MGGNNNKSDDELEEHLVDHRKELASWLQEDRRLVVLEINLMEEVAMELGELKKRC